ncbi:MAG: 6,7-dimethyl-8-ribityllumazine synthase [Bacteroidia bacterium]|nr:6,7-dimethyl-8-ribityllumazine synthase [Bacteroidia bacterium]
MSTQNKNLSSIENIPNAETARFGIVVSDWNTEITSKLFEGAYQTLIQAGCTENHIKTVRVPGSFELPLAAQKLAESSYIDAVICLGCVIQGETPHFDFVCNACANGIMEVGLKYNKPVTFGVLTTLDLQQAQDRAGGKYGNKGVEAAATALIMLASLKK